MVNFTCQVRSKHTQSIMLSNRTNQTWNLHPIFEGEHWEGPEFITLEPHQQNKPYEITYRPRTMNVENRKHQVRSCTLDPLHAPRVELQKEVRK